MKIVRAKPAAEKCGGSVPWLWNKSATDPDFPKPVKIGPNITGWVESELDAYLERKVAESRAKPVKRETAIVAAKKSALARRQRKAQEADHAPA